MLACRPSPRLGSHLHFSMPTIRSFCPSNKIWRNVILVAHKWKTIGWLLWTILFSCLETVMLYAHSYCLEGKTVFLIESGKFIENDLRALQAWGRGKLHMIRTQVRTKSKRFNLLSALAVNFCGKSRVYILISPCRCVNASIVQAAV